ncbi:uncharacterized protein TNCV_1567331 [Trichonephila clavipes]|nr:uncharacterized protein TNCV_1567331 [Trichonephila clavipes]
MAQNMHMEHSFWLEEARDSSSQTGSSSRSVSYPSGFPESSSSYHVTEDSDDDHQEVVVSNPEVVSDHKRMVASEETLIHQIAPRPRSKCSLRSHLLQYGK